MRKQCHKHEKYAMRYIQLGWNLDFCHSCHVTLMASHWVKHCLILVVCVCDRVVKVDQIDICDLFLWNVICCFQSLVEKNEFICTYPTNIRKKRWVSRRQGVSALERSAGFLRHKEQHGKRHAVQLEKRTLMNLSLCRAERGSWSSRIEIFTVFTRVFFYIWWLSQ